VILCALAKSPQERYPTMAAFEAALDGQPAAPSVPARPSPPPAATVAQAGAPRPTTTFSSVTGEVDRLLAEVGARPGRRPVLLGLGAAALAGALGWALWPGPHRDPPERRPEKPPQEIAAAATVPSPPVVAAAPDAGAPLPASAITRKRRRAEKPRPDDSGLTKW
jgi:hypothetical protein